MFIFIFVSQTLFNRNPGTIWKLSVPVPLQYYTPVRGFQQIDHNRSLIKEKKYLPTVNS